jgi:hypothetical protein
MVVSVVGHDDVPGKVLAMLTDRDRLMKRPNLLSDDVEYGGVWVEVSQRSYFIALVVGARRTARS